MTFVEAHCYPHYVNEVAQLDPSLRSHPVRLRDPVRGIVPLGSAPGPPQQHL